MTYSDGDIYPLQKPTFGQMAPLLLSFPERGRKKLFSLWYAAGHMFFLSARKIACSLSVCLYFAFEEV